MMMQIHNRAEGSSGSISEEQPVPAPPLSAHSSSSSFSCPYTPLSPRTAEDKLVDLTHPYTGILDLSGRKADGLSFQPCTETRCQDRYVIEQFPVRGSGSLGARADDAALWTLTGVFDGHLGETTVEHVAHHLPVIVQEFLEETVNKSGQASLSDPKVVSDLLKRAFISFDNDISNDVLELFPGGLSSLDGLSDEYIRSVINDYENGLQNYKKVQLNLYGTTALVALVDPQQENLWIANLGDCQAVLATQLASGKWSGELLTEIHNGSNPREVERIRQEHPNEPDCVINGRILGAIAPFRCFGDQPFKQPPKYTERILFNLDRGENAVGDPRGAWNHLIQRNLTPPYLSAVPDVVHRRIVPRSQAEPEALRQILILCTDGLADLLEDIPVQEQAQRYVDALVSPDHGSADFDVETNLALRILKHLIDDAGVSQLKTPKLKLGRDAMFAAQRVVQSSSGSVRRTLVTQTRSFSNTPDSSTSKPESSHHGYLNTERKRKLVTLYHKTENFITAENLSTSIDKTFTRRIASYFGKEVKGKTWLKDDLTALRENPKMTRVSAAGWRLMAGPQGSTNKDFRLKMTIYGLDESQKASLEMAEELEKVNSSDSKDGQSQPSS